MQSGYTEPGLTMVSPYGPWSLSRGSHLTPASGTINASANVAHYFPIWVPVPVVAKRMWVANGSTASGNIDLGIYADNGKKPGTKLISTGSTAQSGTSVVQFIDITDTTLTPGLWWLAISANGTTGTAMRTFYGAPISAFFKFVQATAFALPTSATPAAPGPFDTGADYYHLFGFSTTTIT